MRKYCVTKFTGEHNAKKYFKKFSFCGSISLKFVLIYAKIKLELLNYVFLDKLSI